ncbi:MAG TPA: cell division protein ZipA C-terminal FtsZ-binding domain-containing protein [Steroidobacteraceae bacterium]|jgi:cell division protein ZipA
MTQLRWILVIFGVVLLLGIYLWGRRGTRQPAVAEEFDPRARPEPRLHETATEPDEDDGADTFAGSAAHASFDESFEPSYERGPVQSEPFEAVPYESAEEEVDSPAAIPAKHNVTPPAVDQFAITAQRPAATYRTEAAVAPRAYPQTPSITMDKVDADAERSVGRRGRIEPTFGEDHDHADTEQLPVHEDEPTEAAAAARDAPTLGMSSTPAPRRIERRKIIALRLAAGSQRLDGGQLRETLEAEDLQHGKYDVYHRLHDDGSSIFSVASMVEPGTFDRDKMPSTTYPGITLFAQMPGPIPGVVALNELVACGRRLQEVLGGTLQDERGVPLTVHRIERLRVEIRDFEHSPARDPVSRGTPAAPPAP